MDLTKIFAPQNRRLIKLTTPFRDDQTLLLEHFSGHEGLSTLFSFELSLISQDARLELKSLIGQPARLDIELADGGVITQYRETDLDFVLRLLEQDGLFFYFDHGMDGHRLIITDESQALQALPEQPHIRYHSAAVTETGDAITQWRSHREMQSGKMAIQTFDYKQPRNPLPIHMDSLNEQGNVASYEIYDVLGAYSHRLGRPKH